MTAQAPKPDEDRGRVIRFEPRRAASRPTAPPSDRSPVADLHKYAAPHAPQGDDRDDYRHRMKANAAALVLVAVLIWCGYWLFDTLAEMRRNQECALVGRPACAAIKLPVESR